jgi:hypothetical protein
LYVTLGASALFGFLAGHAYAGVADLAGMVLPVEADLDCTLSGIRLAYGVDRVLAQLGKDVPIVMVAIEYVPNELSLSFVSLAKLKDVDC